ncbi:uncharacterized protein [Bemisia tabaci]|uniref:uncharacterized protein isoform X3 n=2 Tax=Bemisia tabaci TaxID=7038 RepID=UPI0008F9914A|nr:PREDICTED: uncharacterized protein LOC109043215 isoform X2 [Bemisia tabaci]
MPYIIVSSIIEQCPRKVSVSGLKVHPSKLNAKYRQNLVSTLPRFYIFELMNWAIHCSWDYNSCLGLESTHVTYRIGEDRYTNFPKHRTNGQDIEQLAEFRSISQIDEFTVLFREHVCVMLSALEVLGYQVVTSSSTLGPDPAHITHIWTMRRALADPDLISADDSP